MNAVGSQQPGVGRKVSAAFAFLLFTFYLCLAACSIPNLEPQSCIDSRTAIREFYSFHFGNGLGFEDEDLDKREQYLTPTFFKHLRYPPRDIPPGIDPFTRTDHDPPKAFRVGECREIASDKVEYLVLLFWRDDNRTEQREIKVDMVKENERWLVDSVIK